MHLYCSALALHSALLLTPHVSAVTVDISSAQSLKTAVKTVAGDLLRYYNGSLPGEILGLFQQDDGELYWWASGAAWGSLINYWSYTGDSQFNDLVAQGLLAQVGPNNDFMPPNQTKTEGNDDQGFWALAAMTAAEHQFPSPSTASNTTWLDLARNVFDLQVRRWDTESCGGGLRWQIFTFNNGYDYKNSLSTGNFFQLAARLARYTNNQTYADWAEKSYGWLNSSGLITADFKVFDGAHTIGNCKDVNRLQWTNNAAGMLYGSAVMYNLTNGTSEWKDRTQGFTSSMSIFARKQNVLNEVACEPQGTCNTDQFAFKGLATQSMGAAIQVAPFIANTVTPYLQASAKGAAASCVGGDNETACGFKWTTPSENDGSTGFGQEFSAMNVMLANLAAVSSGPSKVTSASVTSSSRGSDQLSPNNSTSPSATPVASQSGEVSNVSQRNFAPWNLTLVSMSMVAALSLLV